jgi:hypothetical protein
MKFSSAIFISASLAVVEAQNIHRLLSAPRATITAVDTADVVQPLPDIVATIESDIVLNDGITQPEAAEPQPITPIDLVDAETISKQAQ